MYGTIEQYLADFELVCEISRCLSVEQLERLIALINRVPTQDVMSMRRRAGAGSASSTSPSGVGAGGAVTVPGAPGTDITRPSGSSPVTPPTELPATGDFAAGALAHARNVLCHPVTRTFIAAIPHTAARVAGQVIEEWCEGRATAAALRAAVSAVAQWIMGQASSGPAQLPGAAPMPQLGAGSAMVLGVDRLLRGVTSSADATAQRVIASTRAQDVIHAVELEPDLDVIPVPPFSTRPRESRAAIYMLEAATRSGDTFARVTNADAVPAGATPPTTPVRHPDMTIDEVAALAAALFTTTGASPGTA